MNIRSGQYITNLSGDAEYKSFKPAPLPPESFEIDNEMISLLITANKNIASLETVVSQIPSIQLFISMYIRKEALMSSQIEGTQTTLEDVLNPNIDENTNRDVSDVINYIKATEYSIERLKSLPLCNRLIREAHSVLMHNARGQDKNPGEFRSSQNWIGGQGSTIKNARYIPPNVLDMNACISDLEKYINEDDSLDNLIRAAFIHYQFETIHPFLDGNGRVGRLLITLFLMEKKVLSSPALYISYFLKKNRIEYYDRMSEVRRNGNYEQWVKFFLQAIAECAEDAYEKILQLKTLHDKNYFLIKQEFIRPLTALRVLDYLEQNPIIDVNKTAKALNLTFAPINKIILRFVDLGILSTTNKASRFRTFAYTAYLDILRDGTD